MVDVDGNDSRNCNSYNNTIKYIIMNTIKHLKEDKIELNGIVYKPYKVCELPPSFGEDILSWVNYKGYTYIAK